MIAVKTEVMKALFNDPKWSHLFEACQGIKKCEEVVIAFWVLLTLREMS